MRDLWWIGLAIMVIGQLVWLFSAEKATKWLTENDPEFEPPGLAAKFFLGRLITSFAPIARYAELAPEKGASPNLPRYFWGGFMFSLFGVVVLFVMIGS